MGNSGSVMDSPPVGSYGLIADSNLTEGSYSSCSTLPKSKECKIMTCDRGEGQTKYWYVFKEEGKATNWANGRQFIITKRHEGFLVDNPQRLAKWNSEQEPINHNDDPNVNVVPLDDDDDDNNDDNEDDSEWGDTDTVVSVDVGGGEDDDVDGDDGGGGSGGTLPTGFGGNALGSGDPSTLSMVLLSICFPCFLALPFLTPFFCASDWKSTE